jgi:ribonuclease P protein component
VTQKFFYSKRLHRSDEFENILKSKALSNHWLSIHVKNNELGIDRLGVIVSKRVVHMAVARNKIKRIVREIFRRSESNNSYSVDMIIRLKRPIITSETLLFKQSFSRLLMTVRMVTP